MKLLCTKRVIAKLMSYRYNKDLNIRVLDTQFCSTKLKSCISNF